MKPSLVTKFAVLATLSLALGSEVKAKNCDIEQLLTAKQIKALNQAGRLKRVGLNSTILGKEVYDVEVLSDAQEKQAIVLLGEAHIKGPRSHFIGKKIVKQFVVRFLEGIPRAEYEYIQKNDPQLSNSLGWGRILLRGLTFNFFGSTISDAKKRGLGALPGYSAIIKNDKVVVKTATDTADQVVAGLRPLILKNPEAPLNLPLEVGAFLTPSQSDSYILDQRNVRMVDNLVAYNEANLKSTNASIAVVGANHVEGMVKLLARYGFESCSNF